MCKTPVINSKRPTLCSCNAETNSHEFTLALTMAILSISNYKLFTNFTHLRAGKLIYLI